MHAIVSSYSMQLAFRTAKSVVSSRLKGSNHQGIMRNILIPLQVVPVCERCESRVCGCESSAHQCSASCRARVQGVTPDNLSGASRHATVSTCGPGSPESGVIHGCPVGPGSGWSMASIQHTVPKEATAFQRSSAPGNMLNPFLRQKLTRPRPPPKSCGGTLRPPPPLHSLAGTEEAAAFGGRDCGGHGFRGGEPLRPRHAGHALSPSHASPVIPRMHPRRPRPDHAGAWTCCVLRVRSAAPGTAIHAA